MDQIKRKPRPVVKVLSGWSRKVLPSFETSYRRRERGAKKQEK